MTFNLFTCFYMFNCVNKINITHYCRKVCINLAKFMFVTRAVQLISTLALVCVFAFVYYVTCTTLN